MVVLSRKRDEEIVIGESIIIRVVDIRGDKVRLGIEAPREVSVHRLEVYEAIKRENMKAGKLEKNIEVDTGQGGSGGSGSGGLGGSDSGGTGGNYQPKLYPSIY